jgi:PhnB protein
MNPEKKYIRHGFGSVRPYIYGHLDLLAFVQEVFDAQVVEKVGDTSVDAEVKIGDSMLALALGDQFPADLLTRASIYVYVNDVDVVYARALQAGATSLRQPKNKPYQERTAGVRDTFGNIWWIATYVGS